MVAGGGLHHRGQGQGAGQAWEVGVDGREGVRIKPRWQRLAGLFVRH